MSEEPQHFTILLVEDETQVRNLLCRMLEREGYGLLVSASSEQALELAKSHEGPIHLLVVHWTLQRVDGPSLAARIQSVRPLIKVILMSASNRELPVKPDWTFIAKPFENTAFLKTVKDLLNPGDARNR